MPLQAKKTATLEEPIDQPSALSTTPGAPVTERPSTQPDMIVESDVVPDEYAEALKFNEEPMTVYINKGHEKWAPNYVECSIQGRGAEMLVNGKWVSVGVLPVEQPVVTKRKYVEVLARSRTVQVSARHDNPMQTKDGEVRNHIERSVIRNYSVTLVNATPRDIAWLQTL